MLTSTFELVVTHPRIHLFSRQLAEHQSVKVLGVERERKAWRVLTIKGVWFKQVVMR
jgi:hypothetical protein